MKLLLAIFLVLLLITNTEAGVCDEATNTPAKVAGTDTLADTSTAITNFDTLVTCFTEMPGASSDVTTISSISLTAASLTADPTLTSPFDFSALGTGVSLTIDATGSNFSTA
jgi:hypothetical protein